jgi:hypothetical protein
MAESGERAKQRFVRTNKINPQVIKMGAKFEDTLSDPYSID